MNNNNAQEIIERIKARRCELGLSYQELSDRTGLSKSTLQRYETGDINNIPLSKIDILAKGLQVEPQYILGWERSETNTVSFDNIFPIETKRFPLLGEIACGQPIFVNEDRESYIQAGTNIQADFCLKCNGDSMKDARILDGDIVFIRKQPTVDNGQIAAVIIENEATLKRVFYYPESNKLVLSAANSLYEPLVYTGEELNRIRILGLAVAFQSDAI